MKKTPTLLASALLACCMPLAALASEATLSPATNNGSGQMPSGYSQLNFHIGDGDWAGELRLPTAPSQADRVTVVSEAEWGARLELAGTAFAAAGGVSFGHGDLLEFSWNANAGQWDLQQGTSARALIAPNAERAYIANSYDMLTQYTVADEMHVGQLNLPHWAPESALLTVVNRSSSKTRINMVPASTRPELYTCASGQSCTFTYVAGKREWTEVVEGAPVRAARKLSFPRASVTRMHLNPAYDLGTAMTLPAEAVHGDVYAFLDPHGVDGHRIEAANTSMTGPKRLEAGKEVRLRYDRIWSRWDLVN